MVKHLQAPPSPISSARFEAPQPPRSTGSRAADQPRRWPPPARNPTCAKIEGFTKDSNFKDRRVRTSQDSQDSKSSINSEKWWEMIRILDWETQNKWGAALWLSVIEQSWVGTILNWVYSLARFIQLNIAVTPPSWSRLPFKQMNVEVK
jgi:hypothetical protein